MRINLERRDNETRRWHIVAVFDCGTYAMWAARALSEGDGWEWRLVDNRHPDGPIVIIYKGGVAS